MLIPIKENETLVSRFQTITKQYSDKNCLIDNDGYLTYKQLDVLSDQVAAGLMTLGVKRGTKVGLWSKEQRNAFIVYLGIEKSGATAVLLNTSWTEAEINDRLRDTDVEYLFFDDGDKIYFPQICSNLKIETLKEIIYIGKTRSKDYFNLDNLIEKGHTVTAAQLINRKTSVLPEDEDSIIFTSGSTSSPKGVVTTQFSRVRCAISQTEMLHSDENDNYLVAIPLFHCFSITANVLAAWMTGACITIPESRKTEHLLEAIEYSKCTILNCVPTLYSALLANKNRYQYDISSIRTGIIGGSLYSESFFKRVCAELGIHLIASLGQTEATSCVTCTSYDDPMEIRSSTVGHFVEGTEGCIQDPATGKMLPLYIIGEICFRGFNNMKGYYKQPELTAKTIDSEGFIHTGDLGFMDANQNVHMTGRLKEMIIRGGENIAPGEIESAIMTDDRIAQVKVLGIPDEHYGEEICAMVISEEGKKITPMEIRTCVGEKLAHYKVPKYVIFTDHFPLTQSGKVDLKASKAWAIRQCRGN